MKLSKLVLGLSLALGFVAAASAQTTMKISISTAQNSHQGIAIATFAVYNEIELAKHEPDLIYVDSQNRITRRGHKIPTQAAA